MIALNPTTTRGITPEEFHERRWDYITKVANRVFRYEAAERRRNKERMRQRNLKLAREAWAANPNRRPRMRRVQCVETGEVFQSVKAAANHIGVWRNALNQALITGHACKGLHWKRLPHEWEIELAKARTTNPAGGKAVA